MNARPLSNHRRWLRKLALLTISATALSTLALADELKIKLSGDEEVPPAKTAATGAASVTVNADMTVKSSITTSGVAATMAHIHQGAAGANGPVAIPFSKSGDNAWTTPAGAKLTEAQYQAFKAGNLYINVHSAQYPGGEIRGQIKAP